ncbi:PDZ domain-containing protein [Colwellia sp. 1_MG-2023]|uniref:PDZ domain-containing protein n=1 Tax=Colwellia sp. 1_MG-2023 TaxID=3062649 RepID=UPI0026E1982E|nr:PDZ domain-containing protein [Colwellia sp. 1_MG-2023]MDO6445511.1 PDZ domain-containing protein [Colwellia sp. 1_MG-2023]
MKLLKLLLVTSWMLLSFSSAATLDSTVLTDDSQKLIEQLQKKIEATRLAIAVNESNSGNDMENFYHSLSLPEKLYVNLGVLLNRNIANTGYQIISVKAGSSAEKLGLKVNDFIQHINGIELKTLPSNAALNALSNIKPNEELTLGGETSGNYKEFKTKLSGVSVPAVTLSMGNSSSNNSSMTSNEPLEGEITNLDNACGAVSLFRSGELYDALFKQVDGLGVPIERRFIQLPVGKHQLSLYRGYNGVSSGRPDGKAMPLEIDIQANTTYYVAVKIHDESRFDRTRHTMGTRIQKKIKWQPVIWKTETKECSL